MKKLHGLKEHLNDDENSLFEEAVEAVLSKEKLRGSDYRLCCIVLVLHLGRNCRLIIRRLLYTLAELYELLYVPAEKRVPRFILLLHNVTFSHVIAVRKVFQIPQVLTYRKLFGIYYHSITCHAPLTSRLISLSSVDTKEEENSVQLIQSESKQKEVSGQTEVPFVTNSPRLENLLRTYQIFLIPPLLVSFWTLRSTRSTCP